MKKFERIFFEFLPLLIFPFTYTTELISKFKKAKEPSLRSIHVRLGSDVEIPCFNFVSSQQNYGKVTMLLRNANWRDPTGKLLNIKSINSDRFNIDVTKTLKV